MARTYKLNSQLQKVAQSVVALSLFVSIFCTVFLMCVYGDLIDDNIS